MRLLSLGWGLLAGLVAGLIAIALALALALAPLEPGLRAAGCGFFYGLLAFHLQRVDPDDGHLQAGLVGGVCGIRSLGAPLLWPEAPAWRDAPLGWLQAVLPTLVNQWLPLWLPLIGAALVLPAARRHWSVLRP